MRSERADFGRLTLVVDDRLLCPHGGRVTEVGGIIGAFHGHGEAGPVEGRLTARLVAGPGQKFHEIDVPDNVMPSEPTPADLARLPQLLKTYLRKR